MKLVLLGAAGSGKGTLAKKITRDFGIPQLSMGDIFRDIAKSGSELGLLVQKYMSSGALVPDKTTFEVLKERLFQDDCKKGYILDGFPRTLDQAKLLAKVTDVDAVVSVELPFEELEKRLVTRRNCQNVEKLTIQHMKATQANAENVKLLCFSVMTINLRQ